MNELDELLMEHDLLNESPVNSGKAAAGGRAAPISATIHVTRANGTSSPDHFDFEDVMEELGTDGIEHGGGDLDDEKKHKNTSKQQ